MGGFIFQHTHGLILSAGKTQTRRVVKDGEILCTNIHGAGLMVRKNGRTLHYVGQICAVQPGRGLPAVLYNPADLTVGGAVWDKARVAYVDRLCNAYSMPVLMELGWRPLRVKITAIRQEPLQSISEADAIAEGARAIKYNMDYRGYVFDVPRWDYEYFKSAHMAYRFLWGMIKRPKAHRWSANPLVNVYTFEIT